MIAVGRKGRDGMVRRGYNVIAAFDRVPDPPSFLDITPIARVIIDSMLSGEVDQVFIGYSEYVNLVTRQPVIHQLLPLKPADPAACPARSTSAASIPVQASQQSLHL